MNNGQMDRGNENPTQHLHWWLTEFELGTSQIRVQCVTTAAPSEVEEFLFRRIDIYYYHHVKDFYASVLKRKISSIIWLTLSKFFIFTLI